MAQPQEERRAEPAVDGVVLAAGRSRRMGEPKALLDAGDETFLERAVRVLRDGGVRNVLAIVSAEDNEIARHADRAGARVVINTDPGSEQVDSLRLAFANLRAGCDAAVVMPVDQPLVQSATVARLLDAFRERRPAVVRPVYRDEPGHPTLFARAIFEAFSESPLPDGAESVIAAHADEVLDVEVDDAGVAADVNTPDDYRERVERK